LLSCQVPQWARPEMERSSSWLYVD
jgi:hypothetical protein